MEFLEAYVTMPVIIFIVGLLIGSFLNVCIYRIPKNKSVCFPPSHCPDCSKRIKYYDLIPVISYIILKGRCRFCRENISPRYPLIELFTGLIFTAAFLRWGITIEFIKIVILISVLIIVTFIDFEYCIIPGKLMIFTLISGIILNIIGNKSNANLLCYLYGFLAGGGVLLLIVLLTGGMGGGDVQLMAVIGLFLGLRLIILNLLLSFIIGAAAGITLILLKKKKRRDYIPFGPWISAGTLISVFWGDWIINWYISLL